MSVNGIFNPQVQPAPVQMEPTDPQVGAGAGRGFVSGLLQCKSPFLILRDGSGRIISSLSVRDTTNVRISGSDKSTLRIATEPQGYTRSIAFGSAVLASEWADGKQLVYAHTRSDHFSKIQIIDCKC